MIILETVLFLELLWQILLILIDYLTHMQILNIYPHLKQYSQAPESDSPKSFPSNATH